MQLSTSKQFVKVNFPKMQIRPLMWVQSVEVFITSAKKIKMSPIGLFVCLQDPTRKDERISVWQLRVSPPTQTARNLGVTLDS